MVPVYYNVRSLTVRKTTTAAALFGIALVVFVIASAMMLVSGIKKTLATSGSPDRAIILRVGSSDEMNSVFPLADVSTVLVEPSVKREGETPLGVGEVVTVGALEKVGAAGWSNVQFRGTTEAGIKFRPRLRIIEGVPPRPGTNEAMVGTRIRGRFKNLALGDSFELTKNRPVRVVGVFDDGGSSYESEVWFDRDVLSTACGKQGTAGSIRVKLTSPAAFDSLKASVESKKQLGLEVIRETDFYERQSEGLAFLMGALGGLVAVFCSIGAMIGAMITMYGSIANRQREIGTLRALGFSRASILVSFLFESVLLTFVGGLLGAAASLGMGFVKFSMLNQASWSEVVFSFEPTPQIILSALGIAAIMGVAGGFFPAVRAAGISPVAAMRN